MKKNWSHYFLVYYILTLPVTYFFIHIQHYAFDEWRFFYLIACWLYFTTLTTLPLALPFLFSLKKSHSKRYALTLCCLTGMFAGAIHLLLISDLIMLTKYASHLNGLVWNLLTTPGGFESMGLDSKTILPALLLILLLFLLHIALAFVCFFTGFYTHCEAFLKKHSCLFPTCCGVMLLMFLITLFASGFADFKANIDLLCATDTYPIVPTMRMRTFLNAIGMKEADRDKWVKLSAQSTHSNLTYPQAPILRTPEHKKYNIIWLTCESLRFDLLTPEIMPNTWALAQQGINFKMHYSGGNGTRNGMFSMFYALYSNCWDEFLNAARPPLLFQWLREDGYHFLCQTSSKFTYPEFDRTIFASLKPEELRENPKGNPAIRDRQNTDRAIEFIQAQPDTQPFFYFSFFEGTHAPYSFPEEETDLPQKEFLKNVNYAKITQKDAQLFRNRYINAAFTLDKQIGRLIAAINTSPAKAQNTIFIINGDHGEEFYEKGHQGHNSTFVDEQIHTPFVLKIPGGSPQIYTQLSHHTDIIPTIAPLLGVQNPASDYSVGGNLLSPDYSRTYFLICGWDEIIFASYTHKMTLPIGRQQFYNPNKTTTLQDTPVNDATDVYKHNLSSLIQIQKDMNRFIGPPKKK